VSCGSPIRFRRTRIEPDALFGQVDFARSTPLPSRSTLNRPTALAFDPSGNLWVVDTGNHRVVRFSAASLSNPPSATMDVVIGQLDFTSGSANAASSSVSAAVFDTPSGIAFDPKGNLFVSDYGMEEF
jgi:DNA-binding beta-propeller fold protein YncE